jgi:sugar transferase EpsL
MKRLFDILFSSFLIIALSPIMIIVYFLVRLKLGTPVIFKQVRPGHHGQLFTLYKFRTMTDGLDEFGVPLPDVLRLTAFGLVLRRWSLDELPQLFNVLGGKMSIVGPRPLMVEYLDRYNLEQFRRHEVKPGITGWAQVNGRNELSWERKFLFDVWYVDHQSIWLDLVIVCRTVLKVFSPEGINQTGFTTVSEFLGTNPSETDL